MTLVPSGQNADFYQSGRGLALYRGQKPLPVEPPQGTPAWWSNEGTKDAWAGQPSRVGAEVVFRDQAGNPLPVIIGQGGVQAGGPAPAPMTGAVKIPAWANDYWTAYLWVLQDPATGQQRLAQGNVWSRDYQKGLADALGGKAPTDPRGFVPSALQLAQTGLFPNGLPGVPQQGQVNGGAPPIVVRPAPPYQPPPGLPPGSGVYVPPPTPVVATYEIYGQMRGRAVPLDSVLVRTGSGYQLKRGGTLRVGISPSQGFGFGGRPGSWTRIYPSISPSQYGLDADNGIVKYDELSRRAYAIPVSILMEIFGPDWRRQVYIY